MTPTRRFFSCLVILVAFGSLFQEGSQLHTIFGAGSRGGRSLSSSTTTQRDYKDNAQQHKRQYNSNDETNATTSMKQSTKNDLHSFHQAVLPLQDWEIRSVQGLYDMTTTTTTNKEHKQQEDSSCQPPPGIPRQCCLGTFAGMGRIIHNKRHHCANAVLALQGLLDKDMHTADNDDNNNQCDVCVLLEQLRASKQTMAFVGDSMSHQIFQGLLCEFYRRNYHIKEQTQHFPIATTRQRRNNKRRNTRDQEQEQQQVHTSNNASLPESLQCQGGNSINHCLHMMRTVQISSPLWNHNDSPVTFRFFHQYRLPFADPQQEQLVLQSADILVVNFGLHWGANYGNKDKDKDQQKDKNNLKDKNDDEPAKSNKTTIYRKGRRQRRTKVGRGRRDVVDEGEDDMPNNRNKNRNRRSEQRPGRRQVRQRPQGKHSSQASLETSPTTKKQAATARGLTTPDNPPTPEHLRNTFADFLRKARLAGNKQVWFRETSMQHFNGDGGDYSFVKHKVKANKNKRQQQQQKNVKENKVTRLERSALECVPHHNATSNNATATTAGWRERVIQEAAVQAKYTVRDPTTSVARLSSSLLTVIPFANVTRPLHALHPYDDRGGTGGGGGDCTHYCSSPFLYMPLWRSLRTAAVTSGW